MAWEWVAPLATAGTGIAGIVATWLASKGAGEVQLRLRREDHQYETDALTRQEKKDAYTGFLGLINRTEKLILDSAHTFNMTWWEAPARGDWTPGTPPSKDHGFMPDDILRAMPEEDAAAAMAAATRLSRHGEDLRRHLAEVTICGTDRVIEAAHAVADDYFEIYEELRTGEFRLIKPSLRDELLDAFREDLGYGGRQVSSEGASA